MPNSEDAEAYFPEFEGAKEILSKRVRVLIDLWELEHGKQLTYPQIAEFVSSRGLALTRQRWSYLVNGTTFLVRDVPLLHAISDFFGVDAEYLLNVRSETPTDVAARIGFLRGLREERVERFAARALSGVSPETLNLVLEAIRSSREKRARGSHESESGSQSNT